MYLQPQNGGCLYVHTHTKPTKKKLCTNLWIYVKWNVLFSKSRVFRLQYAQFAYFPNKICDEKWQRKKIKYIYTPYQLLFTQRLNNFINLIYGCF